MADIRDIRQNPAAFENDPRKQRELLSLREQLLDRRRRISRDITEINEQLVSPDRDTAAVNRALANNTQEALQLLVNNANQALAQAPEYGEYPPFRNGLLQAITTDGIISVGLKKGIPDVTIDMDKYAGTLSNYANAVRLARKIVSRREMDDRRGLQASFFWRKFIYGPGRLGEPVTRKRKNKDTGQDEEVDVTERYADKYEFTMSLRFRRILADKPAPWWKILENGNALVRMKSDRGGVGLPYSPPTFFVKTSKRQIATLLKNAYKKELRAELLPFEKKLAKLTKQLRQVEEDLRLLTQITTSTEKVSRREAALDKIRQRLREKYTQANFRKIEALIDRLAAGERIEGKVSLGPGIRPRVIQILNELNLEYKDLER